MLAIVNTSANTSATIRSIDVFIYSVCVVTVLAISAYVVYNKIYSQTSNKEPVKKQPI